MKLKKRTTTKNFNRIKLDLSNGMRQQTQRSLRPTGLCDSTAF